MFRTLCATDAEREWWWWYRYDYGRPNACGGIKLCNSSSILGVAERRWLQPQVFATFESSSHKLSMSNQLRTLAGFTVTRSFSWSISGQISVTVDWQSQINWLCYITYGIRYSCACVGQSGYLTLGYLARANYGQASDQCSKITRRLRNESFQCLTGSLASQ